MRRAPTNPFASRVPGTIDLEISDPVLMLNEVAKRYETAERVLMEYVDNALDDAEALYRENGEAYPYPIQIDITLDRAARAMTIQDNCRGMTRDTLERVVRNIGESQKKGQTWVNGRFGFGVHAFRAAAESVSFQTKHATGSHYALALSRDQQRGIKEAKRLDDPFPTDSGTGCIVTVAEFDQDWFRSVTVDSLQGEIEVHFERLLARPNLAITIYESGQAAQHCRAVSYEQVEGVDFRRTMFLEYGDDAHPVDVLCKITAQPAHRPVRFFARGRRIGDVTDIKSFMRKSVYKTSVWGHPNLTGTIEVGEIVQPIINRDDFVRTRGRTILYEALLPLEAEIRSLLTIVNEERRETTFAQFEESVGQALAAATNKNAGFEVRFVENKDEAPRAALQNGRLTININHPDFRGRLRSSRQGHPRPSDRLNAYLAAILAAYSEAAAADFQEEAIEGRLAAHLDLMMALEEELRQKQKRGA
jgi:hypothetical protein